MEKTSTNEHVNTGRNRLSHDEYYTVCEFLKTLAVKGMIVLTTADIIDQVLATHQIIVSPRQLANMMQVSRIRHRDGLTDSAKMQLELDSLREDMDRMAREIALLMKERTSWGSKVGVAAQAASVDNGQDPF